jgi:uncharacterized protein
MDHRHEIETITLPDAQGHLIAVMSDTHGAPHANLIPFLQEKKPSLIFHAGDVGGDMGFIAELEDICPTIFVRGNVDPTGRQWPDSKTIHLKLWRSAQIDFLLLHMAMGRLKLLEEARTLLAKNPAQIVVFGHSHVPFFGTEGEVCLFNPGSAGPPRWGLPITMGLIEVSPKQMKFKHFNLKTKEQWTPAKAAAAKASESGLDD